LLGLLFAGCASEVEKTERQRVAENSRAVEQARMRAIGSVGSEAVTSERGAEILVFDPDKSFDLGKFNTGGLRTHQVGAARTKEYYYEQKMKPTAYRTRDFWGNKRSPLSDRDFATSAAPTRGKYEIPNATTKADTKAMPVNEAREASKMLATRTAPGSQRPYLGKESSRLQKAIDPNQRPPGWSGDLRELTVDDVRAILNTND
jgi:hypothetical protein